ACSPTDATTAHRNEDRGPRMAHPFGRGNTDEPPPTEGQNSRRGVGTLGLCVRADLSTIPPLRATGESGSRAGPVLPPTAGRGRKKGVRMSRRTFPRFAVAGLLAATLAASAAAQTPP